jgi:SAM-dependent methyltransferase
MRTDMGHLEALRSLEIEMLRAWFKPGMRVLEIGGGSGFQASIISSWGCNITSIDLADRPTPPIQYHEVVDYDGHHLPVGDGTIDLIYSSNVLEHIKDLPIMFAEIRRALATGGLGIHVLPSATWRLWSSLSYYPHLVRRVTGVDRDESTRDGSTQRRSVADKVRQRGLGWAIRRAAVDGPHGEYPNALAELYFFSRMRWRKVFHEHGFRVLNARGSRIFYTGYSLFPGLPMRFRRLISPVLGSACHLFVTTPTNAIT